MNKKMYKILNFNELLISAKQNILFEQRGVSRGFRNSGILTTTLLLFAFACSGGPADQIIPISVQGEDDVSDEADDDESREIAPISLSLSFSPEKPTVLDVLRVVVDSNARPSFEWSVNGEILSSVKGKILKPTWFGKGDEVSVRVVASDGERKREQTIKVRVVNMPPRWDRDCRGISGDPSGYRVRASDPDSEAGVLFSLSGEPKGLTIGELSGVLSYRGTADAEPGNYKVSIIATDAEGATADHCAFSIAVSSPRKRP